MRTQNLSQQTIIEAGAGLIEAQTPLTFSNIARGLGVKSQALYPYFANQAELRQAIVAWAVDQLTTRLRDELFGLAGKEAVTAFAEVCRQAGLTHPNLSCFVLAQPRAEVSDANASGLLELHALLAKLLAAFIKSPSLQLAGARYLRNLIVGEIENVAAGWFTNPALDQAESFSWMIETSLNALITADAGQAN